MANAQVNNVDQFGGAKANFPLSTMPHGGQTLIMLVGGNNAPTAYNWYRFQRADGSTQAAYSVASGKTFKAIGMFVRYNTAATVDDLGFGHSSATFTDGTNTEPTSPIYYNPAGVKMSGSNTGTGGFTIPGSENVVDQEKYIPMLGLTFPASRFPFFQVDSTTAIQIRVIGYEE